MTKIILVCAGAALVLSACEQNTPTAEAFQPPQAPSLTETKQSEPPPPPPAPEPTPAPVVEAAPPPAKPTIGSFVWAIARISITTDDGIMGVPPGTKLRVVGEKDGGYIVSNEKQEFPVAPSQISMDSAAASGILAAEAAARAAEHAWRSTQKTASQAASKVVMASQAVLEMQNRYDLLAREEAGLKASLQRAHQEDLESYNAKAQRRVFTRSINSGQVSAWRARLPIVQAEKDKLYYELQRARQN